MHTCWDLLLFAKLISVRVETVGGGGGGGVQHHQIFERVDISLIDNDSGNKNIATKHTK